MMTEGTHIRFRRAAAALVFAAMLVAALSLWSLIPLGWIYVGARLSSTQFPAMGPYLIVAAGIIVSVVAVALALARLSRLYEGITGSNRIEPGRASWLRSMRDTGATHTSVSVVEVALISSAALAGIAFVVWFFVAAGSPLPNG